MKVVNGKLFHDMVLKLGLISYAKSDENTYVIDCDTGEKKY